jgi:hypothetical protein
MKKAELYELIDIALAESADEALSGVRCLREELEWLERRAVFKGRAEGRNWAEIGRLLDTSRQDTHRRFSKAQPPFRVQPPDPAVERERTFKALLEGRSTPPDAEVDDDPIAW